MYRFVIIDDEPVVREGMAENIDWAAHGFELVAACRDGREGMAAIEQHEPHVVLSDICMPFVDGLELASFVSERYPATKTILLTGYDEFHYAQEAVKLHVRDFLLKPVTASQLREHLDAIYNELEVERNRIHHLERIQEQAKESLPLLRERFLHRLVRGVLSPEEQRRRAELLSLPLTGPWYCALICDPDNVESSEELTVLAVQNVLSDAAEEMGVGVAFATARGNAAAIVSESTPEAAEACALELAETVADRATAELGITVSVGIGHAVRELEELPDAYKGARQALEHRIVAGPNRITTLAEAGATPPTRSPVDTGGLRRQFARGLKTGSREEAESALATLLEVLQASGGSAELCYEQMHRLLADSLSALEAVGIDHRELPDFDANVFAQLAGLKTLRDMQSWFERLAARVRERIGQNRESHSSDKAEAAVRYINERYNSKEFSLSEICKSLAVSKSYFSALFKEHTGMTFVEYLTTTRIERAKELLLTTDLKSYEIADRVGFGDAHYFSLTFKKQVGASPTEYREQRLEA
ncbi:MAG: helix-turn-helix domain-containing protein [Spirochaetales bacterium]